MRPGVRRSNQAQPRVSLRVAPPATVESVPSMKFLRTLAAVCLIAGCQGKSRQYDNPVVGPAPPRIPAAAVVALNPGSPEMLADAGPTADASQSQIELMSYLAPDVPMPATGPPGLVAARVNGTPIMFADLLEPYAAKLEMYRPHVNEQEFRRQQLNIVQRDLPQVIERMMLADVVLSKVDAEHTKAIEQQLDKLFRENVQQMMQQHHVSSEAELDALLQEQGSSLARERKGFGEAMIARQFLQEKLGEGGATVTRRDLLNEYHDHLDEFTRPEQVKWQQILIRYDRHGGRDGALQIADNVLADLQRGTDFDAAARKYSEEALGKNGGHWDWTQPGSVADSELRRALEELPVGQTSRVLPGEKSCLIVKVTGKRAERTTPFVEVQDDLRKRIDERRRTEKMQAILEEVKAKVVVETMFDQQNAGTGSAGPAD